MRTSRGRTWRVALLTALARIACWGGAWAIPALGQGAEALVTPRPVAVIPPGTAIADRPPEGWSHLIVKSQPRVGAAGADKVAAVTIEMAGLLFTAILADAQMNSLSGGAGQSHFRGVGRENRDSPQERLPAPYFLSNVAIGLGTRVQGRDVIVSSDTQERLGAKLGFIARSVLAGAEKRLARMQCVARSRTMAIIDAPGVLLVDGQHQLVVLRYAILVHPQTGRLDALDWSLRTDESGQYLGMVGAAHRLPASKLDDCVMHVDPGEFTFGVPSEKAFAMERMPQGQPLPPFEGRLKALAAAPQMTPSGVAELETALRKILDGS
jgi:hypothetical protein